MNESSNEKTDKNSDLIKKKTVQSTLKKYFSNNYFLLHVTKRQTQF